MHIGIEVEGRLKGVKTLFCSAEELMQGQVLNSNIKSIIQNQRDIGQLYVSDLYNTLKLNQHPFMFLSGLLFVTVECTQITDNPDYVSIMLHVTKEAFWKLKPTDQVKFTQEQFVYSVTVEDMTKAVPDDFKGDVKVE